MACEVAVFAVMALHEHFDSLPDEALVVNEAVFHQLFGETVVTFTLHFLRHIVIPFRGDGTGTHAVLGDERHIVLEFLHGLARVLELLFGLMGEAHDDVGEDGGRWQFLTDGFDDMSISGQVVVAVHALQHVLVAALDGDVDLLAEAVVLCHHFDDIILHITGMRCGVIYPKLLATCLAVFAHAAQQFRKVNLFAFLVEAVGVDILSQQGDALVAFFNKVFQLSQNLFRRTRHLAATGVRHGAVGAELVAAVLDRDEGLKTRSLCRCDGPELVHISRGVDLVVLVEQRSQWLNNGLEFNLFSKFQ